MPRDSYYLPSRKLVSQDDAALIQKARVPRSQFTNQFSRLTTFDAGYLVPFLLDEVLPGDHMRYSVTAYIRMATALFPMFSNQRIDTFFFFVPNRLVYDDWAKLMGEQATPASSIAFTIPIVELASTDTTPGSIFDQFGIPPVTAGQTIQINVLPFRMYNLIWNQFFRDQNIQDSVPQLTDGAAEPATDFVLLRRAKSHDYFTSALPWPQKGTAIQSLFTGTAPITGLGFDYNAGTYVPADPNRGARETIADTTYPFNLAWDNAAAGSRMMVRFNTDTGQPRPQIYADLAQATGVTINALRQAWLVQDLLERDARGGTRYVELIRSHFGVTNPDFRLQRPEYIGGGQTPLNLTPIAQTTPTGGGGLGALGATGTAAGTHGASYAATEHGFIIGLINVRTELHYQKSLHKMWTRSVRTDHYFPALAGLGEQAILRQEIYMTGLNANDSLVFGYQERWHEYRTRYSDTAGLFRSGVALNIDEWHLAQEFSAAPTLSAAFIQDTPPMERVLAAGVLAINQQYLADILINRTATRPIPMFGTPATLARF